MAQHLYASESTGARHVYFFGGGSADGGAGMKETLGGKGAGLAEMVHLGVPVPPGFTIATDVCRHVMARGDGHYPDGLEAQVQEAMARVEALVGAGFGDAQNPLLVSVRSGARVSMPGMMDTVLNLGLNDRTVEGLVARTGDARFAWDSYRRFVQMYGDVVLGLKPETREERDPFEVLLEAKKEARHVTLDTELSAADLQELVGAFKDEILRRTGHRFPEEPREQLWGAIAAVFKSWDNPRAVTYRKLYSIPGDWGTAVTVQAMVFGNMGADCATGVAFTRDPSTGERRFFGEFLVNAQGEDVVAGIRTPQPLTRPGGAAHPQDHQEGDSRSLEELMPAVFGELTATYQKLERHYRDMQDIEFTIQRGKLWMLQTRTGKRAARAMVRIAVEMVDEGLITPDEALARMDPAKIDELLHPALDPKAKRQVIARGLPASPGAAVGKVVFHADDAEQLAAAGEAVILVRIETSPEDIHGMKAAQGIVTARGGMTSHAAVVARGMGKCCVAGCGALVVDYVKQQFTVLPPQGQGQGAAPLVVKKGDVLTLDGGARRRDPRARAHGGGAPRSELGPAHDLGRRRAPPPGARQRRHRHRRRDGASLRRRGHRPVPHRAHVLRARPHPRRARDDPRRRRVGAPPRAGEAPAHAARRLHRHLPRHGGSARHGPPARPAAARVPAPRRCRAGGGGRRAGRPGRRAALAQRRAGRVQPDAGFPRLPPGRRLPRDLRDPDPRHHRGGVPPGRRGHRGRPGKSRGR